MATIIKYSEPVINPTVSIHCAKNLITNFNIVKCIQYIAKDCLPNFSKISNDDIRFEIQITMKLPIML